VFRALLNKLRRPPIRMGSVDNSSFRTTPIRNAGFVSFFNESKCVAARNTDHHDTRLRRQKLLQMLALIAVTALCTWVLIESAQAFSTF